MDNHDVVTELRQALGLGDDELARRFVRFMRQHVDGRPGFKMYSSRLVSQLEKNCSDKDDSSAAPSSILPAVFRKDRIDMIDLHPLEIAGGALVVSAGLLEVWPVRRRALVE